MEQRLPSEIRQNPSLLSAWPTELMIDALIHLLVNLTSFLCPGPAATIVPVTTFPCAFSGMYNPPFVFAKGSAFSTKTLSNKGKIFFATDCAARAAAAAYKKEKDPIPLLLIILVHQINGNI